MTRRLSDHKYSQCHVVTHEDGAIDFISYNTLVIRATPAGASYRVECTGTYSQTTRKQIGWFLKEYFPQLSYFDMKNIAHTGKEIFV